jgi:hypothetical protein
MKPNRKKKEDFQEVIDDTLTTLEKRRKSKMVDVTDHDDVEKQTLYVPAIDRKADKVCIIAFGKSKLLAPFGDKSFEFWGFNDPMYDVPTLLFDRFFQLHATDYLASYYEPWLKDRVTWQRQDHLPIYMQEEYEAFPQSIRFPKEAIEALTPRGWYHAATMDWLTAFAILEGFKEIHWYGLGKNGFNGEPISCRPCLEYWFGVAEGRGIKIHVAKGSDCFKIYQYMESERQYAWDESAPFLYARPEDDERYQKELKAAQDVIKKGPAIN